ncbi:MAG: ABC transporter permease [Phycisphaerae bacterium]|nr:ABC transporter permease [Phycisphaerae bacterium]MBN8596080.1 ABC transporter permease [Planctomycetota bacterium]
MIARSLEYRRDLIAALLIKELRARYKRTVLGYAWSLLNPLAMAAIYFVLVNRIFAVQIKNYPLVLVAGLFPWQWVANSVTSSTMVFIANAGLIRRTSFPRAALLVSATLNDLVHYLASVPVIIGFMLWFGIYPDARWIIFVPLLIVVQWAVIMGIAFIISSCNVFFRDLERITTIGVTLWFYMTPIIYTRDMLSGRHDYLLIVNPVAGVLLGWRSLFMGESIDLMLVLCSAVWGAVLLSVGYAFYRRVQWRFAELV